MISTCAFGVKKGCHCSVEVYALVTHLLITYLGFAEHKSGEKRIPQLTSFSCFFGVCSSFENNATLYRTEKHCRHQNRPKIGKKMTKNRILALFGQFFVTFKMIDNWGSVGGRRVLFALREELEINEDPWFCEHRGFQTAVGDPHRIRQRSGKERKPKNIKFLGGLFLGHQGSELIFGKGMRRSTFQ